MDVDALIAILVALALPGLIMGVLSILLTCGFCMCANCPLNCCTKSGYVACGESCSGAPPKRGYSKTCRISTGIILFTTWIVVVVACALSFSNETHDAVVTFTDLTVDAVRNANLAFRSSNAVIEASNEDTLFGIKQVIGDLSQSLSETNKSIDQYSKYVYTGNDIRSIVVNVGVSLVLVALLFWLVALATKARALKRTFAVFACLGLIFSWFAFGVQLPMTVFVDVTCAVSSNILANITNAPAIDISASSRSSAVLEALDSKQDLQGKLNIGIPPPIEAVILSCAQTNSYLAIFANSINLTQSGIDLTNQFIDEENIPVAKFLKVLPMPTTSELLPPDWSDQDLADKLAEAANWTVMVNEKVQEMIDNAPVVLRRKLREEAKIITKLSKGLTVLSELVLIITSDFSCSYVKNLIVELTTSVCVTLPSGMQAEAWTFFIVAIVMSLTLSLSLNAFEQVMYAGYSPAKKDLEMDGVVVAHTATDLRV